MARVWLGGKKGGDPERRRGSKKDRRKGEREFQPGDPGSSMEADGTPRRATHMQYKLNANDVPHSYSNCWCPLTEDHWSGERQ